MTEIKVLGFLLSLKGKWNSGSCPLLAGFPHPDIQPSKGGEASVPGAHPLCSIHTLPRALEDQQLLLAYALLQITGGGGEGGAGKLVVASLLGGSRSEGAKSKHPEPRTFLLPVHEAVLQKEQGSEEGGRGMALYHPRRAPRPGAVSHTWTVQYSKTWHSFSSVDPKGNKIRL